jgi:hypothetical protein
MISSPPFLGRPGRRRRDERGESAALPSGVEADPWTADVERLFFAKEEATFIATQQVPRFGMKRRGKDFAT